MTDPEEETARPDELDRLQQLHERTKETQEAWRKLLESLGKLNDGPKKNNELNKPNT